MIAILVLAPVLLVAGAMTTAPAYAQKTQPDERVQALERQIQRAPDEAQPYLALAALHQEAGRLTATEDVLRRGVKAAAEADELRWALAQHLVEAERWADAVEALEPLAPDSAAMATTARLRVNVAIEASRAGDPTTARTALERALEEDPTLPEAALMLGQLHLEAEEPRAAREVVDAALRHSPDDGRLLAVRSATLEGREGLEAAVQAARAVRREQPDDETVALELARLLLRTGELEGTLALYDTLLAGPQPEAETFSTIANFWLNAEQPDTAVSILSRGLDVHPGSGTLWERMGAAEWEREAWRDAALAYRKAAARLDRPERAEMAVADAYAQAGDTTRALDALRTMRERPAPRAARLQVALRAVSLGDSALADSVYLDLLEARPDDARALEGAARLAEARGERDRALELYRRGTELSGGGPLAPLGVLRLAEPEEPDSANTLLRRALWQSIERVEAAEHQVVGSAESGGPDGPLSRIEPWDPLGDARETLTMVLDTVVFETEWGGEELQQLRRAYPQSVLFRRYAADLAAHTGELEEALAGYDRLLTMRADDIDLQRGRAQTLEELGRLEEARAAYTRALELAPEDAEIFRALVRLSGGEDELPTLLAQVRRLQKLHPELEVLVEREVELLHRLGRLSEAREAARKHQETSS